MWPNGIPQKYMNVDHVLLHIFTAKELALFEKLNVSQQYNDSLFYAPFWPSKFKPLALKCAKDRL